MVDVTLRDGVRLQMDAVRAGFRAVLPGVRLDPFAAGQPARVLSGGLLYPPDPPPQKRSLASGWRRSIIQYKQVEEDDASEEGEAKTTRPRGKEEDDE